MFPLTRRDVWILIRGILIAVLIATAVSASCAAIISSQETPAGR